MSKKTSTNMMKIMGATLAVCSAAQEIQPRGAFIH